MCQPLWSNHSGESIIPAAPAVPMVLSEQHKVMVQHWLNQAQAADDGSMVFQRGIAVLERLLNTIVPEKTALLANYPNPFNPETWFPYQLANEADVGISIYSVNGQLIRTLHLGTQPNGAYITQDKAAYWDGRSDTGEQVSSGAYFYHFSAGDYQATKKMIILK